MASVWTTPECHKAFRDGSAAAARGSTRNSRGRYGTYNERAAFNDGWDTYTGGTAMDPAPAKAARPASQGRRQS